MKQWLTASETNEEDDNNDDHDDKKWTRQRRKGVDPSKFIPVVVMKTLVICVSTIQFVDTVSALTTVWNSPPLTIQDNHHIHKNHVRLRSNLYSSVASYVGEEENTTQRLQFVSDIHSFVSVGQQHTFTPNVQTVSINTDLFDNIVQETDNDRLYQRNVDVFSSNQQQTKTQEVESTNDVKQETYLGLFDNFLDFENSTTDDNVDSVVPERVVGRNRQTQLDELKIIQTKQRKSKKPVDKEPYLSGTISNLTCRVVTLADGKLRTETLPEILLLPPRILQQMENIYYAISREKIQPILQYVKQQRQQMKQQQDEDAISEEQYQQFIIQQSDQFTTQTIKSSNDGQEQQLVSTVRKSLEDAGFNLLSSRDLDLCNALNAGYLLRLSIMPELSTLDRTLGQEFYPELYNDEDNRKRQDLLFDGKVLIFYRGYSQEVSKGRLILPKLDYLQASLVERLMNAIKVRVDRVERILLFRSSILYRNALAFITKSYRNVVQKIPKDGGVILQYVRIMLLRASYTTTSFRHGRGDSYEPYATMSYRRQKTRGRSRRSLKLFETLSRYSSPGLFLSSSAMSSSSSSSAQITEAPNPIDPLGAFSVCEKQVANIRNKYMVNGFSENDTCMTDDIPCSVSPLTIDDLLGNDNTCNNPDSRTVDQDIYELLNNRSLRCPYDNTIDNRNKLLPPMQLLQRVSLGNLVDLFTKQGRKRLVPTIVSESKLVEPTYEEVIVIWRPKRQKKKLTYLEKLSDRLEKIRQIRPPKFVYDLADMFDIDGLPEQPKQVPASSRPAPIPIEIRAFQDVPMANLKAVMPNTKLKLGPADALRFDLISIISFLAVASSVKFDNPKLDVIALVTVILWVTRTIYRYSNKLARYDLVVKTFLTSKISHRNTGAIEYLANEAASQRAARAALVHYWLTTSRLQQNPLEPPFDRSLLRNEGRSELNDLLTDIKETPVDIDAALNDLIDLKLLSVAETSSSTMTNVHNMGMMNNLPSLEKQKEILDIVQYEADVVKTLKQKWDELFVV